MKNDPLVAKLYNKMQQEQNEYRAWLLAQPPEVVILNHAYADGYDKAAYYANLQFHAGLIDNFISRLRQLERDKTAPER